MNKRQQLIFCICGPTASGKSSICGEILKRVSGVQLSVSSTTRKPRANELNARDYFFLTQEEFSNRIKDNQFIEYAEYSGNLYGTEKRNITSAFKKKNDLILEIEVQGVQQIKKLYPRQTVTIFVFPPSYAELEARLRKRATDSEAQIKQRLEIVKSELEVLSSEGFSDYLVVNEFLDTALKNVQGIIEAERLRYGRQDSDFIKELLK